MATVNQAQVLASQPVGVAMRIAAVSGPLPLRRRLLEMGLTPGTIISVVRRAPLGDPIELRVRQYLLSLRLAQASAVTVTPVEPPA